MCTHNLKQLNRDPRSTWHPSTYISYIPNLNVPNTVAYFLLFRYDPSKGMESLEDTFVSKANAMQRKGRAGRVASGVCFHLFTSHHYNHHLLKQPLPEIQRVPLEQLCLR